MSKTLISAYLLGQKVRYDANHTKKLVDGMEVTAALKIFPQKIEHRILFKSVTLKFYLII